MPRRRSSHPEKVIERMGDRLMHALGFTAIHFSQPRNSMQTPGIADRRYYSPERRAMTWWEAKTPIGRPSVHQVAFRALVESCGEEYVIGTDEALVDWAVSRGFCERLPGGGLRVIRPGAVGSG